MADNVTAPVTGETFATKDASGVHHPRSLLEHHDGSGNPVQSGTSNPLPVSVVAGSLVDALVARSSAPIAAQPTISIGGIRDDALASISGEADEGEVGLFRLDGNGALWVQLAGALSSTVDSVALAAGPGMTNVAAKYKRVTTASTGVDLWDPTLDYVAVKWYVISWSGANACRVTIWQGANADTTFTDGTDRVLFDIDLAANANGGVAFAFPPDCPWETDTADHELHLTTSAAKTVSITIGGFEHD